MWMVGGLGVLLAVAAGVIAVIGMPTYEVPRVTLEVEGSRARVERGKRLVGMLCRRCHFDAETGRLSGRELVEVPDFAQLTLMVHNRLKTHGETLLNLPRLFGNTPGSPQREKAYRWARRCMRAYAEWLNDPEGIAASGGIRLNVDDEGGA